MEGYTMTLVLISRSKYELIQLVDQVIDSCLEGLQAILVSVTELVRGLLDEFVHVSNICEVGRTDLIVNRHLVLKAFAVYRWCLFAKVFARGDLERALPVLTVHGDHKVLEVVQSMHICGSVLFGKLFANLTR